MDKHNVHIDENSQRKTRRIMSDQDFILVDEEEKESTGADEVDKEEKKDHLAVKKEEEKETEKDNDDDGYEKICLICHRPESQTGKMMDLALGGVVEGTWLHQWSRTSGLSQCWALEPTRNGRTRIRNVLADKYIDLVGMNTSNGAQAQIWNFVSGGNQEWNLERVDSTVQQTRAKTEEAHDPEPTPSQRKHQNDLVRKLNNAGKGRAGRKA